MPSNYEIALKKESKLVVRCFVPMERLGIRSLSLNPRYSWRLLRDGGIVRYLHPSKPGVWFRTRKEAAVAALSE